MWKPCCIISFSQVFPVGCQGATFHNFKCLLKFGQSPCKQMQMLSIRGLIAKIWDHTLYMTGNLNKSKAGNLANPKAPCGVWWIISARCNSTSNTRVLAAASWSPSADICWLLFPEPVVVKILTRRLRCHQIDLLWSRCFLWHLKLHLSWCT